jgi:peptidylprolyl isomerase
MRRITIALSLLAIVACKPAAEPAAETTSPTAGSGAVQEETVTTTTTAAGEGTGSGATAVTATNTAPGTGDALAAPSDVAAPPAGTPTTATGLASRVLTPGTGTDHPGPTDTVTVHYTGWQTDGTMFDSSVQRGEPISFPLNRVIEGWREGVQLMVEGEKRRMWIPEALAYRGQPGAPAGMLVFDVELISIVRPPAAPADVAAPPADAEVTASGLASKLLAPGTGTAHPAATSTVEVHYSGWTTDGNMFDSSVTRGRTATFPLNGVIAGWTEGLQLMVEGEKRRFWIPEALAYGGRPGRPAGMLVFDVELVRIVTP